MLNVINSTISLESLIWLFPITFMIHDFEEIIFVESWFKKNYTIVADRIPRPFRNTFREFSQTTAARFSIPVFFQLILYSFSSYLAVEQKKYGMFVGFNVLIFLHIFTHLGQTIYFRTYALGTGTAIFITFPYSIYLFYRLLYENIVTFFDFVSSAPYGLLTVLVVLFGHKLAPKILRR
ncbi:MAG: HXXEE domain-containing protein [Bacillota bacterium]|nr:HXXEE domain-containing protein [Bacillota bacterium]